VSACELLASAAATAAAAAAASVSASVCDLIWWAGCGAAAEWFWL
jgi:hypothetical protein